MAPRSFLVAAVAAALVSAAAGQDVKCSDLAPQTCGVVRDQYDPVDTCMLLERENESSPFVYQTADCDLYSATPVLEGLSSTDSVSANAVAVAMSLAAAGVGLMTVAVFVSQVLKFPEGNDRMKFISQTIHEGAKAFLHKEYTYLAVFVTVVFAILCGVLYSEDDTLGGVHTALAFLLGAVLSASAGYFGMYIATKANVRTTQACTISMNEGLRVAFKSGAVMGFTVVSFGLLGLSVLYLIFIGAGVETRLTWQYMSGFGFGASSIALFARVGGGVYTKAADVGADLVGKVEAGIPEDDPYNPAVIADNVGDNVGDVAGMGADLFESYCGSIIAAATIGFDTFSRRNLTALQSCCQYGVVAITESEATNYSIAAIALPFWIAGFGLFASVIGTFFVRTNANETMEANHVLESLLWSIRYGIFIAAFLVIGLNAVACYITFGGSGVEWNLFGCTVIGLVAGNVIGTFTEYCTSYSYSPTTSIARKSNTGPATVIIQGLGVGMISTGVPLITLVITVISCNVLASRYGIALSAVSMLATLGITLATDAYGPVADNAGGIAEMVEELSDDTRTKTDALDALGNTTAATGKGFAIGSAALTSVALIAAFINQVTDPNQASTGVNIEDPVVLSGMLLGSTLPFIFAALTMLSVGRAAESIIYEVRRQFANHPELKTASVTGWKPPAGVPDYERCVSISTEAALEEMVIPGVIAIFSPPAVGYLLGSRGLVGMLVGSLTAGILLAITMANAGGAWDNAKKYVEKGSLGADKGKNTPYHEAVVVGDTVGDPFKDTSGPALNILIKMMSLISLVLAPSFRAVNPKGDAFGDGWYIGLIIIIVVGLFVFFFNRKNTAKYNKISKELEEAASKLNEGTPVDEDDASPSDNPEALMDAASPASVSVEVDGEEVKKE